MTTVHRAGTVSTVALSALGLVLGAAQSIAPRWVKHVGLDVWNFPSLCASTQEAREQTEELRLDQERMDMSIEAGEHVAVRLVAGTMTLAQAIDELEPLLRARPGLDDIHRIAYQTKSPRQGVARYIVNRATRLLDNDPSRRAAVSARLEAEFAAVR
jgi:hypothetical protein